MKILKLNRTQHISVLTKGTRQLLITHAIRQISNYQNGKSLVYQHELISLPNVVERNILQQNELLKQGQLLLQGVLCYHCRMIIRINSYHLRKKSGKGTKPYHIICAVKVNLIHWSLLLIIVQHGIVSGLGTEAERIEMLEEIATHVAVMA